MNFHTFYGQSRALEDLKSSFQSGRVAHGYLLTGPEGSGKRTLARLCAKALLCAGVDKPCGACGPCHRVEQGTHPDYIEVAPEKAEIGVGEVRQLLGRIAERPYEGDSRAVLLLGALGIPAQNALLKTLEQPPEGTVFFLTAQGTSALLPTVVSRMRVVFLGALPFDLCARALVQRGMDPERAQLLSKLSGGLIGQALAYDVDEEYWRLRDLAYAFFAPEYKSKTVDLMIGYKDIPRQSAPAFLSCLENVLSDVIRAMHGAPLLAGDRAKTVESIADATSPRQAARLLDALMQVRARLKSNITWQSAFEPFVFAWVEGFD